MQNTRRVFLEPILRGGRFNDASLPLEIFPDLDGYTKIVIAVAKELYRKKQNGKNRLPNGFEERFKVRLTEIRPGSTVPVFSRDYEQEEWVNDEFDQARDIVNQQLLSLDKNDQNKQLFSKQVVVLFKSFGENLKPDETIELRIPGQEKGPNYSKKIRSRILSLHREPYMDICRLSGAISGFDAKKGIFYLVQGESRQIIGPLNESFDLRLREIAAKYKQEDIRIALIGRAKYQPDGAVQQIEQLQHMTVFKNGNPIYIPDPVERIDEFSSYLPGWFDGHGSVFKPEDLFRVKNWLSELLVVAEIPAQFIYPSPDNMVRVEWSFGFWEISCSFEFLENQIEIHATRLGSEETREDKVPFDLESVQLVSRFLKDILRSQEG